MTFEPFEFDAKDYPAPHCNPEVLHAPGACWFCDHYSDRQAARAASGTEFTPAEANGWQGNVAQPNPRKMPPYREMFVTPADLEVQPSWRSRLRAALHL